MRPPKDSCVARRIGGTTAGGERERAEEKDGGRQHGQCTGNELSEDEATKGFVRGTQNRGNNGGDVTEEAEENESGEAGAGLCARERVERNRTSGAQEPALENEAADDDACQESGKHQSEGIGGAAEHSSEKARPRDFVGDGGGADDSEGKEQKAARGLRGVFGCSFGGDAFRRSLRGCGSFSMG